MKIDYLCNWSLKAWSRGSILERSQKFRGVLSKPGSESLAYALRYVHFDICDCVVEFP